MYIGYYNTIPFIIITIVWLILIGKIFHVYRLEYRLGVFLMIISVICIAFLYEYIHFADVNKPSRNAYKIKEAFLDYSFNRDYSANVNHKLFFEPNKNKVSQNSISYIFYETGDVNSLEVKLNGNSIKLSDKKSSGTYEFKTNQNKNLLTVYFLNSKPQKLDLDIKYSVKNAFLKDNGLSVYYNTFFSERTDFSFNTNTKGNITFHYPEGAVIDCGTHSTDFWVNLNNHNKDSLGIDFQNKIPYEKSPFFAHAFTWRKVYDPVNIYKDYIKDFSLITRVNFSSLKFEEKSNPFASNELNNAYSVSELKLLNKENNEQFSDVKFIFGIFIRILLETVTTFLFVSSPIIYLYYIKERELYFVYYREKIEENS